jgi:hypothetical protein
MRQGDLLQIFHRREPTKIIHRRDAEGAEKELKDKENINRKGARDAKKELMLQTHCHARPRRNNVVLIIFIFTSRPLRLCGEIFFVSLRPLRLCGELSLFLCVSAVKQ